MIWINDKSYEFINNMTIFTFLKDHKIFLPALNDDLSKTDNELCMVEIENQRELVNAKLYKWINIKKFKSIYKS